MLSDFDLAKQSNEPSGMPTMVHSEHNGVSTSDMLEFAQVLINFARFRWWTR